MVVLLTNTVLHLGSLKLKISKRQRGSRKTVSNLCHEVIERTGYPQKDNTKLKNICFKCPVSRKRFSSAYILGYSCIKIGGFSLYIVTRKVKGYLINGKHRVNIGQPRY